jgi:hypothetical protein
MAIRSDIEKFANAVEALLQSISSQELTEEEAAEVIRELHELAAFFPKTTDA